jgi:hypothetical protein
MRAPSWLSTSVVTSEPSPDAMLARWSSAGLITAEQVARIRAHEDGRRAVEGTPATRGSQAEVVGYIGAAFALGAALLLLAEFYADLVPPARVALAVLVALGALVAGAALVRSDAPPLRRLTAVLWAGALVATAWTSGVIAADVVDLALRWIPTAVGAPTLVIGLVLLAIGRHELVQLATLVALITTVLGVLSGVAVLTPEPLAFGLLLLGVGLSWSLAGAGGWLGPRWTAELAGGAVALIGTQIVAVGDRRLLGLGLGLALAVGAVVVSVPMARPRLLALGAIALFILVPQLVFELFADTLGAPATLLAVGLLLIVLAVGIGRVRRVTDVGARQDRAHVPSEGPQEVEHG